jgi:Tfp pilus assembly protein PilF
VPACPTSTPLAFRWGFFLSWRVPSISKRTLRRLLCGCAIAGCIVLPACSSRAPGSTRPSRETRERAYSANNVGVALLEQLKYPEAATAFRDALTIDPTLAIAHLNLSLALLYEQDLDAAAREAADADKGMPSAPQPPYVLGLVARAQSRNEDARAFLQRVRQIDAGDVGTNVNLAQIDLEDRRYAEAAAALQPIVSREPYHVTAAYVFGLALTRSGRTEEGQRQLQRAQDLRRASYAVTFGTGYLEQGRYAEAIASTGTEPELISHDTPPAKFTPAPLASDTGNGGQQQSPLGRPFSDSDRRSDPGGIAGALGGGHALVDVDADGSLELIVVSASGQRLYRRDARNSWQDTTAGSGLEEVPAGAVAIGVISADVDNDGAPDLYVLRYGASSLYHNDGKGHFSDVTRSAKLPAYTALPGAAAFVDVDHDGDVDLLVAGLADLSASRGDSAASIVFPAGFAPAPLQLLRNNGNGTFTDITREAKLDTRGHAIAVVPTDFDNHRDIDLLVVNSDGPPQLFSNQRDGTFRDAAAELGLAAVAKSGVSITAVAVGDVNQDDWPDFFFARSDGAVLALSDGQGRFTASDAPAMFRAATAAQFVDYDNDGQLDLAAMTAAGLVIARKAGPAWVDVTAAASAPLPGGTARTALRSLAAADIDRDGNMDLVSSSGSAVWMWHNSGDPRNHSLRVQLRGRVTNRLGVGSKVQVRAGSLSARFETSAATPPVAPADILFGLGPRAGAEVVRVLWPSGILQAETAQAAAGQQQAAVLPTPFSVEELDRKPSSCPFLFTWNGARFEFITDFLGGGEMGYWEGPGMYNHPDPVEFVRIRGDQLVPVNGRLQLRVTNELEEVVYLDRMQLMTVTHPADVQVYPNEGMAASAKPFRLYAVRRPLAPARVTDDHGHDVTARIAALDRTYPDDFTTNRIRGYAEPHSLTIDLGHTTGGQTLLLTGWTDYAFSSDNVAAHQAGMSSIDPVLDVREASGRWRRLDLPIGIPVGRPQTIPLDLSGQLRPGEREVRLSTNMRIYWDQIQVGLTVPARNVTSTLADPRSATLQARGFSAEVRPDGQDPPGYDYARVSSASPWKVFTGNYTREGDVLSLLTDADDRFVIGRTGDQVSLEFDAPAAAVPAGWTRTYLLRGDGFSKEMDVNSASPDSVEPLPFHGMSRYPYPASEHYPDTPAHTQYREQFNTRRVVKPWNTFVSP